MHCFRTYRFTAWLVGTMLLALTLPALAQQQCDRTWTLDADFALGHALNVNSGAGDELTLNTFTAPLPYVYIAASNLGTVVKIDVNTGAVVGEYKTAPDGNGRDPSRTTVDRFGNCWVANRAEAGALSSGHPMGSVMRIGVVIGGTRCDADGSDNPVGDYLKPPFDYNTCIDRDHDGLIRTSRGLGDVLAWTGVSLAGDDREGGVATAEDEAIINYTRVHGTNARTMAIDANNDIWVGGLGNHEHEKLSGLTGEPIPGTWFDADAGGYGGLVDQQGVLWSASGGGTNALVRYVPALGIPTILTNHGNYGIGVSPVTGHIWHSSYGGTGKLYEFRSDGTVLQSFDQGFAAQGVCVDANDHVWVAQAFGSRIWHLAPNPAIPGTHYVVGFVTGLQGVTGVAVDANGKIWAAEYNGSRASRIDPNPASQSPDANGNRIGAIETSVALRDGSWPYNYSDMTGFVTLAVTNPSGSWTVVKDGGIADGVWGKLSWMSLEPTGSAITVQVRAANSVAGLPAEDFVTVGNGIDFCGQIDNGRYLEIRVVFTGTNEIVPILYDLELECCNEPPVAVCRDIEIACGENCTADPEATAIDGGSFDPDGTALEYSMAPEGPFGLGSHDVVLTVTDVDDAVAVCNATITVVDRTAPTMTMATTSIEPWPPNHQYVTIQVSDLVAAVSDACDATLDVTDAFIRGVTSDEPDDANGNGDGATVDDIVIAEGCQSVDLRVERDGNGNGRVYVIYCSVIDASENITTLPFPVVIRHNSGDDVSLTDPIDHVVSGGCGVMPKLATPQPSLTSGYSLEQNIPNPFSSATEIPFSIGVAGHMTLSVYDALGIEVARLLEELRPAGPQSVEFDAALLPRGTYYCVLEAGGLRLVQAMTLSK